MAVVIDSPIERRNTERRKTERRTTERRNTQRQTTECRKTELRKLPDVKYYPTSKNWTSNATQGRKTERRILTSKGRAYEEKYL